MAKKPDLDSAYALGTPEDSVRLYRTWASSYDSDFAHNSDYILHEAVARQYALVGGFGPVLDVGAGTGLCGEALRARGIVPVDGIDISREMLNQAATKDAYRNLFTGNVLKPLRLPHGQYQGAVSSGTFTTGHVGPAGIDRVIAAVRTGGWIVISVNTRHYKAAGFEEKLDALEDRICDAQHVEVPVYGPAATGEHAKDVAKLLTFRKA